MPFTILPPSDSESESDSDHSSRSPSPPLTQKSIHKPPPLSSSSRHPPILVPGALISTEPQWMRGHGTYIPPTNTTNAIHASLPGPLILTNKLLSISPLRARYSPSIGDLVLGRISTLERSRWRVDISAPVLASLPLSSINLPGGVLRRRTTADELQMRRFFQEGDLVLAEVQSVGDGGSAGGMAGLHARSLRFGRVRDGVCVEVGSAGVRRGRRQVFGVDTTVAAGGGAVQGVEVEVKIGVNGWVWVGVKGREEELQEGQGKGGAGISNLDELVSDEAYSSQNQEIRPELRREMARICACLGLLTREGVRVDEETVLKAYQAAVEEELGEMNDDDGDEGRSGLGGKDNERRIIQTVLTGLGGSRQ